MNIALIIMAAGDSTRFCAPRLPEDKKPYTKKQWIRISASRPLWLHMLNTLSSCVAKNLRNSQRLCKIIITASSADYKYMQKLAPSTLMIESNKIPLYIAMGGDTRYRSLLNALKQAKDCDYAIVSDCARCNIDSDVLESMLEILDNGAHDCIAPFIRAHDSVIYMHDDNSLDHINRDRLALIQTPQITRIDKLLESAKCNMDFSDESSAILALNNGNGVHLVEGSAKMGKLTTRDDLFLLRDVIDPSLHDTLIGQGNDIHAFQDGKPMRLCGVDIESSFGFKAHSDGDVGIHAVIDSILGAMNYGDIGEIFPDTESAYKDADSRILLKQVYDYCLSVGLEIINLDISIIAQAPRISPYKSSMQECLAEILYLDKSQVSIKASTAEQLGFIGRREGIFVTSIAQLKTRRFE